MLATRPPAAVLFDYGGLFTGSFTQATRNLGEIAQQNGSVFGPDEFSNAAIALDADELSARLERGQASEGEFEQRMVEILAPGEASNATDFFAALGIDGFLQQLWAEVHRIGKTQRRAMMKLVKTVRSKGLRTAILSNSLGTKFYHRTELDDLFDTWIISGIDAAVGMRKPEKDIYLHTAAELKVVPQQCVFVDDSLRNVETAQELGMDAFLYRDPESAWRELAARGCVMQ